MYTTWERFLKIRYSEGQLFGIWSKDLYLLNLNWKIFYINLILGRNINSLQLKNFFDFAFKNEKTLCSLECLKVLNLINSVKKYSFSKWKKLLLLYLLGGGSRLPHKNKLDLLGHPLVAYSIYIAKLTPWLMMFMSLQTQRILQK